MEIRLLPGDNANSRMEFNTDVNVANLRFDDNQKASFGNSNDYKFTSIEELHFKQ